MNRDHCCRYITVHSAGIFGVLLATCVWLLSGCAPIRAQGNPFPPATIVNDEGGTVLITGEMAVTNVFFGEVLADPVIFLEDQAGFVDRDFNFIISTESQTLGQITSTNDDETLTYRMALPIEPKAALRDVDNDGETDTGVMVYAVAFWTNMFGDIYMEARDLYGGGWSGFDASTRTRDDFTAEVFGGKLLVYAPDKEQGFPVDFGDDGLLFTADDPVVGLPQGYTVVDLDTSPFTFDRSRHAEIELIVGESALQYDFSQLSYTDAFDALIEVLRKEYAFTEYKQVDWDALVAAVRPLVVAAAEEESAIDFRRALRQLALLIPDGHVSGPFVEEDYALATDSGLGIAMRELDDGRNLINYVTAGSPAQAAGIELGAEILAIDGVDVDVVVAGTTTLEGSYSVAHDEHLQQLRYALRAPVGAEVELTFINPGEEVEQTVVLEAVAERESFDFFSYNDILSGTEPPVYFAYWDNGYGTAYGYVRMTTFEDDGRLTVNLWERMLSFLTWNEVPGLIIDLRQNGGGDGYLADYMAAYFFDEPLALGNTGYYDKTLNEFYMHPADAMYFVLPPEELRFDGEVVLLVGPNCASACEFFAYNLTLQERAAVIGHYPTAGLGGSIDEVWMPEDESFVFTAGRSVDANGEIHLEGIGVMPTIDVPLDEAALFSESDPLLDAAFDYLDEVLGEGVEVPSTPQ